MPKDNCLHLICPLLVFHIGEGSGTPLQYSCLETPWTEKPGGLQSMGSLRVGLSDFPFTFHFHALEKEMATHYREVAWLASNDVLEEAKRRQALMKEQ